MVREPLEHTPVRFESAGCPLLQTAEERAIAMSESTDARQRPPFGVLKAVRDCEEVGFEVHAANHKRYEFIPSIPLNPFRAFCAHVG